MDRIHQNFTSFTKIPIFDNTSQSIHIGMPMSKESDIFIHCYDDFTNQSIQMIYTEYNTFLEKKLASINNKPLVVMMIVKIITNEVETIFTYDITLLITSKLINSIKLFTITSIDGLSIKNNAVLTEDSIASIEIKSTSKNLFTLGIQKLSMFIKFTDVITKQIVPT